MGQFLFGFLLLAGLAGGAGVGTAWGGAVDGHSAENAVFSFAVARADQAPQPIEQRLRRSSFLFLKTVRRWWVRITRFLQRTAQRWARWTLIGAVFLAVGAALSAIDRRLLALWRRQGARVAVGYALIGMAVFFRLLRERRVPRSAQLALALALAYGVIVPDLLADTAVPLGWADDVAVVGFAARWFVRRCPSEVIEEHAARARRAGDGMLPPSVPAHTVGESKASSQ